MGLTRLLLLMFLAWLVWWLFKPLFRRAPPPQQTRQVGVEDTVRCLFCQVNLPKQEALEQDGEYFCNTEHRQHYQEQQK